MFKSKLEPTSSQAQASSKALFLKYRSNAINQLRLEIIDKNTKAPRVPQTVRNKDLKITANMEIVENQMFDEDKSQMSTLRSQTHAAIATSDEQRNMTSVGSQMFTSGLQKVNDLKQTIEVEDQSYLVVPN